VSKPTVNSEFAIPRIRACEPRDATLAQVRDDYQETLRQIAEIEKRLLDVNRDTI
jgi:hypothetical protein